MSSARIEHANITVKDPEATAELLCTLFDWHVRWKGPSMSGGRTVHVGTDADYLAPEIWRPRAETRRWYPGTAAPG